MLPNLVLLNLTISTSFISSMPLSSCFLYPWLQIYGSLSISMLPCLSLHHLSIPMIMNIWLPFHIHAISSMPPSSCFPYPWYESIASFQYPCYLIYPFFILLSIPTFSLFVTILPHPRLLYYFKNQCNLIKGYLLKFFAFNNTYTSSKMKSTKAISLQRTAYLFPTLILQLPYLPSFYKLTSLEYINNQNKASKRQIKTLQ